MFTLVEFVSAKTKIQIKFGFGLPPVLFKTMFPSLLQPGEKKRQDYTQAFVSLSYKM